MLINTGGKPTAGKATLEVNQWATAVQNVVHTTGESGWIGCVWLSLLTILQQ